MIMKVTLKKLTIGSIISFILYVAILFMFFSCRTVKKDWVEENFANKQDISKLETSQLNAQKTLESKITNSVILDFTEKLKIATEKTTNNESETTTVKGSIIAEDGKEKSATVGNTTIKSNGANVTFETTTTKELSKEFYGKYNELTQKLDQEQKYNQYLYTQINSLKSEISDLKSTYESDKTAKSKDVKMKGFSLSSVVFGVIAIIVVFAVLYFRKTIFGWFKFQWFHY